MQISSLYSNKPNSNLPQRQVSTKREASKPAEDDKYVKVPKTQYYMLNTALGILAAIDIFGIARNFYNKEDIPRFKPVLKK